MMKKVLYGTTALVAASMLTAGAASAAEKIKLSVGGYYQSVFAVSDSDDLVTVTGTGTTAVTTRTSYQPAKFEQEGEIHFKGETTLDNGLTVGVQVQLEAFSTGDQIDEHFVYLEGGWGRLVVGAENGAAYLAGGSWAASAIVGHGVDSPNFSHHPSTGSASTTTQITTSGDANKITYYTPRLGGFQLGVSYTPDVGGDIGGGGAGRLFAPLIEDNGLEDVIEVGANYSGTFGGVDLGINAGYLTGDAAPNGLVGNVTDPDEWRVGANIGFGGFNLGANYNQQDVNTVVASTANREDESTAFSVGLSYGTGPWTVAAGYLHSELERGVGVSDDELDVYEFGGSYALGPGVTISAGIQYYETETAGLDTETVAGVVALGLGF
jgi:predicted porin